MENIQEQEVLIARNNETGQVGAVVGQNPDGTPQMADAKTAKLSDLVKFNKGQNPLEAFISNFVRQAKNPSLFGFFKLPADRYDAIAPAMADLIQDPASNGEMLKPYEVDVKSAAQSQEQTPAEATAQKSETPEEKPAAGTKMSPIDPNRIDWDTIEKEWGITRSQLEDSGALKQMVYNHKSPQLFTVTPSFGGERFEAEARLSFRSNPDGTYSLIPHFVKNEPKLELPFMGHEFTKEEKEALANNGNLGHPVELTDPKTGEVKKHLVSIDRLTNEVVSIPLDKVYIKNQIGKTELSMKEIGILKDGGVVRGKEIELNNGRRFTSDLQYNADKRDVEFVKAVSQQQSQGKETRNSWVDAEGNPKRIGKWKDMVFTEQMKDAYQRGDKVEIGESVDKKGQPCTVFLQFDKEKQRPVTEYHYKEQKKVVGVAEESKTQYSVNSEGKTNEATKNISDPLQKGQTAPKNEKQQTEQKKKGPKL